jgi:hypothetical protein
MLPQAIPFAPTLHQGVPLCWRSLYHSPLHYIRAYLYVGEAYTIRPYTLVHFAAIPVNNPCHPLIHLIRDKNQN